MEFEPMLTPREKSPLRKMSPEEDRTRDAVDSEPKHYQLSYSGPPGVSIPLHQTNNKNYDDDKNYDDITNNINNTDNANNKEYTIEYAKWVPHSNKTWSMWNDMILQRFEERVMICSVSSNINANGRQSVMR